MTYTVALIENSMGKTQLSRMARVRSDVVTRLLNNEAVPMGALQRIHAVLNFDDPNPIPVHHRIKQEWEIRDQFAAELERQGFTCQHEKLLPSGRKMDLLAVKGETRYIVEAKVKDALAAIGQLIADRLELGQPATLILLIPRHLDRPVVRQVCAELQIEVRVLK